MVVVNDNLDKLKQSLQTLAETKKSTYDNTGFTSKNFIEDLGKKLATNEKFKSINFNEVLEVVKSDLEEILKSDDTLFPAAYEAFSLIFSSTSEKFRQLHFEELVAEYYKPFEATKGLIEKHLNVILPLVKLKLIDNEEIAANVLKYFQNPVLHQEDVYHIIKKKFKTSNYDLIYYEFEAIGGKFGHVSKYYNLNIKISVNNKVHEDSFFIKSLYADSSYLQEIAASGIAQREGFFYNNLYPLFEENGLEEILDFAPKCYLATVNGIIVLENIQWITLTPDTFLDFDRVKLPLKELAKFHACSLILEEILSKKQGKPYRIGDEFPEFFKESLLVTEGERHGWFMGGLLAAKYYVDKAGKLNASVDEKLTRVYPKTLEKIKKSTTIRNVVNHGDVHVCNMMVREDFKKLIIYDFQLLRYLPPALDILFFLYVSTSRETRRKHLQSIFDYYYDQLSNYLRKFNLNPEEVFSKSVFDKNISETKLIALTVAVAYNAVHMPAKLRQQVLHSEESGDNWEVEAKKCIDLAWQDEHYKDLGLGYAEELVELLENVDE